MSDLYQALRREYDVVVVGSGAGGMAAAITAKINGASVLILEKEPLYGGTTARSGGVLWIPCNSLSKSMGIKDDLTDVQTYLKHEIGSRYDQERVEAFLENGPRMVDFFQENTKVQFIAVPEFSDYHPDSPGGLPGGRSILASPMDGRLLGKRVTKLRPPLREITFVGMMFNASEEVNHFFNATRSLKSARYVVKRLSHHVLELLFHGRAMRLTNGNALVARLAKTTFDLDIPLVLSAPATSLVHQNERVEGVVVATPEGSVTVVAKRGVILAAGGFPQDIQRKKELFSHAPNGVEHRSPAPPGNTGDGLRLAESVGAALELDLPNAAAWIPVSLVPRRHGAAGVFPHLIDRYKPGVIAVTEDGVRFTNESNSYHDVGVALREACRNKGKTKAYLICDHRTLRRYGLGFVKPFPLPLIPHLRSGYLLRGKTLTLLARKAGIDPTTLEHTIAEFNEGARVGEDRQFGRGTSAYNRYLGDSNHQPNPCVAPIEEGPFYAIKIVLGDLGTFDGIRCDAVGRVLGKDGGVIHGLYAVGNDSASIMGGKYPGGGITLGPAMTFGFLAGEHIARTDE